MSQESCYRPAPRVFYITREGWPFVLAGLALGLLGAYFDRAVFAWAGAFFAAFSLYFFRNPDRHTPDDPKAVVSPADGRVVLIAEAVESDFVNRPMRRVSIFMSPLNVHVNRMPVAGTVKGVRYYPGKFFVASLDKASTENERNVMAVETYDGQPVVFTQIAGWLARRILCYIRPGDVLQKGDRCGLIRFGSRVDIFMPLEATLMVSKNQLVRAGETIIGRLP
jgi:phosphatidylserine decarboxylase